MTRRAGARIGAASTSSPICTARPPNMAATRAITRSRAFWPAPGRRRRRAPKQRANGRSLAAAGRPGARAPDIGGGVDEAQPAALGELQFAAEIIARIPGLLPFAVLAQPIVMDPVLGLAEH